MSPATGFTASFAHGVVEPMPTLPPAVAKYELPEEPSCVVDALPVIVKSEPSNVRFASSTKADVPFPVKSLLLVNVVAPVPPFATGKVPVTSAARSTLVPKSAVTLPPL